MQHLASGSPTPRHHPRPLLTLISLGLLGSGLAAQTPTGGVDFNRDIRPILSSKCFACHGPNAKSRKGKLRLDLASGAFETRGKRPAAIVPGDPAASELVRRITHTDPEERMPPRSELKQLDADERQLLIDWIEQGATWQDHWAFVTPTIPTPPTIAAKDAAWARNPIDAFVLSRLQQEGLRHSDTADRATLIRRVSFDLIGLPPSLTEVQDFVADRQPRAYERLVDRLLASPHYGEHMARFWLDAARYGDTHGLHLDNYREMWPYRDWVVQAFNDNMPFDRFAIEQLAGDLLPGATLAQRIASGFNRCHVSTNEGGSIKEEVYVRNVIDRVSTTGTVFLGLTLGCAVCHDHKFDPIPQREFYQIFAFFNNLDANPMDGNAKRHAPVVRVPTAADTAQIVKLKQQQQAIEDRITTVLAATDYQEPRVAPQITATRTTIVWVEDELPEGAAAEGDGLDWVEAPDQPVHSGRRSMKRRSRGNQQHFFRQANRRLRIATGDLLFAWVYLDPTDRPREIMLQWNNDGDAGWKHRAYWGENLIDYGKTGTTERHHMGELPETGKWVRLEIPVASVGLRPGMAVHGMAFTQFDGTAYWDAAGIESSAQQTQQDFVWIDDGVPAGANKTGTGRSWQFRGARQGKAGHRPQPRSGKLALRRKGKGLIQDVFTGAAKPLRLHAGDRLFAQVWLDPEDPPKSIQLQFNDGNWEHRVRWGSEAHGPGRKNGADFVAGPLPATGKWIRLEVSIDKVGLKPGRQLNGWAFTQVDGTVWWDQAGVRTWEPPDDRYLHSLHRWEPLGAADKQVPKAVRAALAVATKKRSPEQTTAIRHHYLRHVYLDTRKAFDPLNVEVAAVTKQLTAAEAKVPSSLVMKELTKPRQAFMLNRGLYNRRGAKVERQTPVALPPMAAGLPMDRLGFARWLVDPGHPLTARVTVNRLWQQLFGTGLVKTSEDFGNQGERPTHPQLLDWLARSFITDGWDTKQFMRRMVSSATYRQSSRIAAASARRDPNNRLLARGPRFRLDAETLRDQALALGGLLVAKIGGPGVKPQQPAGLWKSVGYVGSNTGIFRADKGAQKVHRRSLYTFWKRTSPPPQMTTLDAPSREDCRVRRERTNTPLQALLLMNDPQYVEAARGLATRAMRQAKGDRDRAAWMFRLAAGRDASSEDLADLLALAHSSRQEFAKNPADAKALIAIGEQSAPKDLDAADLATWTLVANLILNLDEVITKS